MAIEITRKEPHGLSVGIIGGGFMAEVHCRAARAAGAQVTGVASSTPASAIRAGEKLRVPTAYESVDEMLADRAVELVHICTPNSTHATLVKAALNAGKHVICEKPLATSLEGAQEVFDLAAQSGKVTAVPFIYRFHPMVREARGRILDGNLGAVNTVQGSYLQDWLVNTDDDDWRVDEKMGGPSRAFADIGSHLCDLVEFVTNERITDLCAQTRTVFSDRARNKAIRTEDIAVVIFRTASSLLGTFMVSQVAPGRKNRLTFEINGTAQSLQFDQEQPETLWVGEKAGSRIVFRSPEDLRVDAARLCQVPAGHPQGYQDAFNAFVADTYSATEGTVPEGLPTFADGLRATQITSAVLESARHGTWVSVPSLQSTRYPAYSSVGNSELGISRY